MSDYSTPIRLHLAAGPTSARQLAEALGTSQPTVSRALSELGDEIVRIGAARSIQYALRDTARGLPDIPIYRVDPEGRIHLLGTLTAVRPDGFVMQQIDGTTRHSDDLPWWLTDMRPQGFLGRAYVRRHASELALPERLTDWTSAHALKALLAHGHDVVGNLLLGERAREHFLVHPTPFPIEADQKIEIYPRMAREAAQGDLPGSSAGGEQPKFTTYAMTPNGPRHVLVKFSESEESPVSERWRDLLLAEHLALETLRTSNIPAATTRIIDRNHQRFLEVERFDRIGALGRRAVFSLAALDAEFVGQGRGGWPLIAQQLVNQKVIRKEAIETINLLWAFGTLIGNSDMHSGNLSFVADHGRPYELAPAYDMTPMAFQPRSGGGLPDTLPTATIAAHVPNDTWRRALTLANDFQHQLLNSAGFSQRFGPCIASLGNHITAAASMIERLG